MDITFRIFLAIAKLVTCYASLYTFDQRDLFCHGVFGLCNLKSGKLLDAFQLLYDELEQAKEDYRVNQANSMATGKYTIADPSAHAKKISDALVARDTMIVLKSHNIIIK
jgi:hypothetical protein